MNCPNCNAPLVEGAGFCGRCGSPVPAAQPAGTTPQLTGAAPSPAQMPQQCAPSQQQQPQQYMQQPQYQQPTMGTTQGGVVPSDSKSKVVAGLLAIFLGTLGIHKFYLGYTKAAIIMLLVSLLTFGVGLCVMAVIALIEGIMYLTKSDWDFYNIYVVGEKQWF